MIFRAEKRALALAVLGVMLLYFNVSAQTHVRYVVPSDIGTKTLLADSVLTSVTLPWGVSKVDDNPGVQEAAFELADILRGKESKLLRVYVCGSASPDGLWQENVALSQARTDAAVRYLRYVTGVPVDKIYSNSLNEDWDRLYELVSESDIPYKEEVLYIITTKTWGERKQALKDLAGGTVWKILMSDFFPQLRCVRIAFYCQWDPTKPYLSRPLPEFMQRPVEGNAVEEEPVAEEVPVMEEPAVKPVVKVPESKVDTIYVRDTVYYMKETVYIPQGYVAAPDASAYETYRAERMRRERAPRPVHETPWMMGFKTNLLGDAIVVPTLGAEFQIGRIMSLDLQGFYSNFNVFNPLDAHTNVYGFSPELRFWPGGKTMRKGQFIGVHARCAWYTLQWTDGLLYQNGPENMWEGNYHNAGNSTPAWSAGMTYGYSLGFGRKGHWGLEFLIGVGYANYKQNTAAYNNGIWELVEHQNKHHFGITRAGVNLTYRFSLRKVNPDYYDNN